MLCIPDQSAIPSTWLQTKARPSTGYTSSALTLSSPGDSRSRPDPFRLQPEHHPLAPVSHYARSRPSRQMEFAGRLRSEPGGRELRPSEERSVVVGEYGWEQPAAPPTVAGTPARHGRSRRCAPAPPAAPPGATAWSSARRKSAG